MEEQHNENIKGSLEFVIGQLSGQVIALQATCSLMAASITSLESRLRNTEEQTVKLMVKVGIIGIVAGGLGTAGLQFIQKLWK